MVRVLVTGAGGFIGGHLCKRLKAEGKLQGSDDIEREAGERSLGGVGLVPERIDEKLPYLEQGYVDESMPDLGKEAGKLFGKLFGSK